VVFVLAPKTDVTYLLACLLACFACSALQSDPKYSPPTVSIFNADARDLVSTSDILRRQKLFGVTDLREVSSVQQSPKIHSLSYKRQHNLLSAAPPSLGPLTPPPKALNSTITIINSPQSPSTLPPFSDATTRLGEFVDDVCEGLTVGSFGVCLARSRCCACAWWQR
jgi:hypothetical protein